MKFSCERKFCWSKMLPFLKNPTPSIDEKGLHPNQEVTIKSFAKTANRAK